MSFELHIFLPQEQKIPYRQWKASVRRTIGFRVPVNTAGPEGYGLAFCDFSGKGRVPFR